MTASTPIIIERPFEGDYYALPVEAEMEIFDRIFGRYPSGEEGVLKPLGRDFRGEVFKAIWNKLPEIAAMAEIRRISIAIVDDRGWTRPYRDILLDIVELILNKPPAETWRLLQHFLGDNLAGELFMAVLRSGVLIQRPAFWDPADIAEWEADARQARAHHRWKQQQGAA